jgi:hypothetical protein
LIGAITSEEIHMPLSWFDAGEAKKFGLSLAQFFIEKYPAEAKKLKFDEKKQEAVLAGASTKISEFKSKQQLNLFKKAQLGNTFKWTLKDAGFDAELVDLLTSWLMLRL